MCNTYPYLCDYISFLEAKVKKTKETNTKLKEQAKTTLHIERLEYKIHELHVQTLSGTMNLGITAQADENTMNDLVNQLTKTGNFNVKIGDQEESKEPPTPPIETHESTTTL